MIIQIKSTTASAQIDSVGAQLISLKDSQNTEYIWQRDPQVWKNCSPILFPIVGGCRDNRTCIDGRIYEIPKHGPCRSTEFHLQSQTESSVTFSITQDDFPAGCFPYKFQLRACYTLTEDVLDLAIEVKNLDSKDISYCIGLHPGINCPLFSGESFEDYLLKFSQPQVHGFRSYDLNNLQFNMEQETPFPGNGTSIPLSRELFSSDAIWFDRPCGHEVSLVHSTSGKGIKATYPDFETVAFWTLTSPNASFVCIEPWNGSAVCSDEDDMFSHKNHLQQLEKDGSRTYTLKLQILNP